MWNKPNQRNNNNKSTKVQQKQKNGQTWKEGKFKVEKQVIIEKVLSYKYGAQISKCFLVFFNQIIGVQGGGGGVGVKKELMCLELQKLPQQL